MVLLEAQMIGWVKTAWLWVKNHFPGRRGGDVNIRAGKGNVMIQGGRGGGDVHIRGGNAR